MHIFVIELILDVTRTYANPSQTAHIIIQIIYSNFQAHENTARRYRANTMKEISKGLPAIEMMIFSTHGGRI